MEEFASTFGEVPPNKSAMAVLNGSGDTKTIWDPNNPAEVKAARAQFASLVGTEKFAAFRVSPDDPNKAGEQIREFDPQARRIIFIPPVQGG